MYKEQHNNIYLPVHFGFIIKEHEHITHCAAEGSYARVFFDDREPVLATRRLSVLEELLKEYSFIRCHKSFLVNINFIKEFCGNEKNTLVLKNGIRLKVACRKLRKFKFQMRRSFISVPD